MLLSLFCLIYGLFFGLLAPYILVPFFVPIAFLSLLVIWALPDARTAPTSLLTTLFFTFFVALVVWPNYIALSLPGLPWITMIRLTGFPLALILLYCVSTSSDFRSTLSASLSSIPLAWKALAAFVLIQAVSITFSAEPGFSIDKFVLAQIAWTSIFFVSAFVFVWPGYATLWAKLLVVLCVFVSAIGVWEHALGHVPWLGHIPSFLQIEDPNVASILRGAARMTSGIYRVQSVFTTSLGLAEYVALTLPFAAFLAFENERRLTRIAGALSIPILIYAVVLTDSRLGMAGIMLTGLSYFFVFGIRRWQSRPGSLIGPAVVLAYPMVFVTSIFSVFFVGRVRHLIWGNGSQQSSTDARVIQYKIGLPMVFDHPWGHGIGTGGLTLGYAPDGFLTIDTYYLAVALEYGIAGFILYYGLVLLMIASSAKHALSASRSHPDFGLFTPIAIALLNFLVIKSVFSQQDNHPIVFMMFGLVVALTYRLQQERVGQPVSGSVQQPA